MKLRVEVVALDCLMVRLFDEIAETNLPWMLAASESLRTAFAGHLIDLVPSYTCLLYTSPSPRDGLLSRMPSSA